MHLVEKLVRAYTAMCRSPFRGLPLRRKGVAEVCFASADQPWRRFWHVDPHRRHCHLALWLNKAAARAIHTSPHRVNLDEISASRARAVALDSPGTTGSNLPMGCAA